MTEVTELTEVIGVDLGGTKVALATLRGCNLGESAIEPTECSGPEGLMDQLVRMIEGARSPGLAGVGIGVPSVVEFEPGRVVSSVNVPLADVPLRSAIGDRLGVPVFIDNERGGRGAGRRRRMRSVPRGPATRPPLTRSAAVNEAAR